MLVQNIFFWVLAVAMVIAALGVVSQLKDAMNTIWNVEEPKKQAWGGISVRTSCRSPAS